MPIQCRHFRLILGLENAGVRGHVPGMDSTAVVDVRDMTILGREGHVDKETRSRRRGLDTIILAGIATCFGV